MGRKPFNAKEHIGVINVFRKEMNGQPFSREQLINVFRNGNITIHPSFVCAFCKSGIVTKLNNGNYIFTSKEPVYYGELARVYRQYHNIAKNWKRQNKTQNNVPSQVQNNVPTLDSNQALTSFAINFLKNLGYKVLKPSTFEEI